MAKKGARYEFIGGTKHLMEQKTSFPVLGESYYKGLEQQQNELSKQAQVLLAQEGQGSEPVEQELPKKKTRKERIKEDMAKGKQVYRWIKLYENHFTSLKMRKLRKQEHGETMTIIYLKIVLHSLKENGCIYYEEVGDSIAEEIADSIGEDKELVEKTVLFMVNTKLATIGDGNEVLNVEEFRELTGADSDAERQRKSRAKKHNEKLDINI